MTRTNRWLDVLPVDSAERQLLLAGRADTPPPGSVDLDWQALSAALGAAVATTTITTSAVATSGTVQAGAASAIGAATTKATVAGIGLSLAAKSVTIGFVLGMGMIGAGTAVSEIHQRGRQSSANTTLVQPSLRPAAPATPRARHAAPEASTVTLPEQTLPPREIPTSSAAVPSSSVKRFVSEPTERATIPASEREALGSRSQSGAATPTEVPPPVASSGPSLAAQAQDLAQVKRLIDGGNATEAIRRLQVSSVEGMHPALTEERDALYVQALDKAQMRAQTVLFAKRFLARYPNSPHSARMRSLIAAK